MISYLQAVVIGLLQGVTELFPVSSLGHSVLVPAFLGGSWEALVTQSATSTSETSPYLAVIVALHVATAVALIIFFRSDWVRIIRGFLRTIRPSIVARRLVTTDADERLAWLLIIATIPVGITGLALEHTFRTPRDGTTAGCRCHPKVRTPPARPGSTRAVRWCAGCGPRSD
jgi:undecaprenyl-diphosphatase